MVALWLKPGFFTAMILLSVFISIGCDSPPHYIGISLTQDHHMNIWILLCPGNRIEKLEVLDNRGSEWLLTDSQAITNQPIIFDRDESRWLRSEAERFGKNQIDIFAKVSGGLSTVSSFAADRLVDDRILVGNGSYVSQEEFLAQDCRNGF